MMVLEILVRMCKFRMRYNTLHKENTAKRKNNILYLGNEGYRKAFSFFKKKILGKRKRIYNNISYLGNEVNWKKQIISLPRKERLQEGKPRFSVCGD